jgi:hypothetical protein
VKISLHEFEAHDVRAPFLVSWLPEILSQSPTSQAPAGAAAPGLADTRKLCKREAPVLTNIFRSDTSETSAKQSKPFNSSHHQPSSFQNVHPSVLRYRKVLKRRKEFSGADL